jgi:hypothetical protein
VTVDDDFSIAEALAVKDGRIVGVGDSGDILGLADPSTIVVDLGGKMVLPGLTDAHSHPFRYSQRRLKLNLTDCRSLGDLLGRIRDKASQLPAGQWVEAGMGWREDWLAEKRLPTRWELDEIAPDHPVYLPHLGYLVVLNSAALARAGIDRNTADSPGGSIGRDANGEPNGVLVGIPAFRPVERIMPPPDLEDQLESLRMVCRQNASWGHTGAVDAGLYPEDIRVLQELRERDQLTFRTYAMFRPDTTLPLDEALESLRAWGVRTRFGDDMLRIDGVKMFVDGGIEGALQRQEYAIEPGYFGQHATPPEVIEAIARLAAQLGWQVGVHACGGAAGDLLLDIYQRVDREIPLKGRRWVMAHAFFPTPANIEVCKRLDLVVSVQQTLIYNLAPNFQKYWGAELVERANPQRTWLDAGVRLAGGIDGTPFPILLAIWSSVTRKTRDAGVLGRNEAITREEAIRMYTMGGAYQVFREHELGSLEVGKLADLIVLDRDILRGPEDDIRDAVVLCTMVGGRVVHGDLEAL